MADLNEQSREVRVKVDVDVSEALTGLKALQREAREATKALRELEEAQKRSQALPRVPFVGHPNTSAVEIDGRAVGKLISDELSKTRTYSKRVSSGGASIKSTPSRGKYIEVHSQAQRGLS